MADQRPAVERPPRLRSRGPLHGAASTTEGKHRSEFRYGVFSRSLPQPANANEDDIRAAYHDGILTVSVGLKVEKEAMKKIEVKSGK